MSSKRSLSPDGEGLESKRPKITADAASQAADGDATSGLEVDLHGDGQAASQSSVPTQNSVARLGLQRAIALALRHDGFQSATPEALESFTDAVETYVESLVHETKTFALASRREHPTPVDFESTLRGYNLPITSLKPHLRNPLPQSVLAPRFGAALPTDQDAFAVLPLLGPELSGKADKDEKIYIPHNFPDFPSRHTYSFSPQEDVATRDPKNTRVEAARTAQHGEDALRRLVRASKMRKQKEVKNLVERDIHGKERFRLWEATMKRFMGADARGEHTDQVEIADHSMIVNGDAGFARKEFPRSGKWPSASRS